MDDRPHPPAYAQHTWSGFSTGKYEGNEFTVYTTHLKRGWIRANGIPQSDEATVAEHFIRHGDRITYFAVVNDPVYLAEPFSRTYTMRRNAKEPDAWLYACDDGEQMIGRPKIRWPTTLRKAPVPSRIHRQKAFAAIGPAGRTGDHVSGIRRQTRRSRGMEAAAKAELFPSPGPRHTSKAVDPNPHDGEIHVLPVQGNVYMLIGDGGNIAVAGWRSGALVVDTGAGQRTDKVVAAIRKLPMADTVHRQHQLPSGVYGRKSEGPRGWT